MYRRFESYHPSHDLQKSISLNGIAVNLAARLPSARGRASQTGSHRAPNRHRDPGRKRGLHLTRRNGIFYVRRRWPKKTLQAWCAGASLRPPSNQPSRRNGETVWRPALRRRDDPATLPLRSDTRKAVFNPVSKLPLRDTASCPGGEGNIRRGARMYGSNLFGVACPLIVAIEHDCIHIQRAYVFSSRTSASDKTALS